MAARTGALSVADPNDVPGGLAGIAGVIAAVIAAIAAGWRMFKTWGPSDANAAANSSAQIAALDRYEKMLEDERTARASDAKRASEELFAVREAWAKDVATRASDYATERTARLASDAKREEALQELWTLRGQVTLLTEQVRTLQKIVNQLQGTSNGTPSS